MKQRILRNSGQSLDIRFSSEDIASAILLAQKFKLVPEGTSLAMTVKWGMSFAMEIARNTGHVPEFDPYQYNTLLEQFRRHGPKVKALAAALVTNKEALMAAADTKYIAPNAIPEDDQELSPAALETLRQLQSERSASQRTQPVTINSDVQSVQKLTPWAGLEQLVPKDLHLLNDERVTLLDRALNRSPDFGEHSAANLDTAQIAKCLIFFQHIARDTFIEHLGEDRVLEAELAISEFWSPNWRTIIEHHLSSQQ